MRKLGGIAVAIVLSFALALGTRPSVAQDIGVSVDINVAPPELPEYDQPDIPGPGYIWTPGYWAWGDDGYFWVPGTWVQAPEAGYLWTPGYWGWNNGLYAWNGGYWGTAIGFYGGVNYGFGYSGHGYDGGYWDHGAFRYNTVYNNIHNTQITNVYNKTVVNNVTINRVSFNGGNGGIQARANEQELAAAHARHIPAVAAQRQQIQVARGNPALRVSANHGHPAIAATARPGEFSRGIVAAHGAEPTNHAGPPANHPAVVNHPAPVNHAPLQVNHGPVERTVPDQHYDAPRNEAPRPAEAPHAQEAPREAPRPEAQRAAPRPAQPEQHAPPRPEPEHKEEPK
jgi:hypothetical protein